MNVSRRRNGRSQAVCRTRPAISALRTVAVLVALLASAGACREQRMQAHVQPAVLDGERMTAPTEVPRGATFVIAAAGDVAGRQFAQHQTAALLGTLVRTRALAAVLGLGDLQYPRGDYHAFLADYDPAWGRLRALTRPVPGNHEYDQGRSDARGYFDYFNGRGQSSGAAGVRGRGWYSFDMGDWHLVALNTSDGCRLVPCRPGAAMNRWLREDLARNDRPCVLAYFHHPRFSNGERHGDGAFVAPLWDVLVGAGVDLVLTGHEHNYQQLAPLDEHGRLDPLRGVRSFVVGTGGASPYPWFGDRHLDAVEARVARHGVLELTLAPGRYSWRFLATGQPGGEVRSAGSAVCR